MKKLHSEHKLSTRCIHAGDTVDPATGAIVFPFRTFTMACGLLTHMVVSRWFSREVSVPLRPA